MLKVKLAPGRHLPVIYIPDFTDTRAEDSMAISKAKNISAIGFYQPMGDERYEGTWFDSRGMVLPLDASRMGGALVTLWGTPDTEQGRTIYRIIAKDRIEVEDYVLKDNEWKQFGEAVYRRE